MKLKRSMLLSLAAMSAPVLAQTCELTATTPYLNAAGHGRGVELTVVRNQARMSLQWPRAATSSANP